MDICPTHCQVPLDLEYTICIHSVLWLSFMKLLVLKLFFPLHKALPAVGRVLQTFVRYGKECLLYRKKNCNLQFSSYYVYLSYVYLVVVALNAWHL